MNSNTFTSPGGWFNLTLPKDWAEYDDEDEGTSAFLMLRTGLATYGYRL